MLALQLSFQLLSPLTHPMMIIFTLQFTSQTLNNIQHFSCYGCFNYLCRFNFDWNFTSFHHIHYNDFQCLLSLLTYKLTLQLPTGLKLKIKSSSISSDYTSTDTSNPCSVSTSTHTWTTFSASAYMQTINIAYSVYTCDLQREQAHFSFLQKTYPFLS